ncbi:MAG: molybdopterin-dependent oxidoreductase [Acidobacteriota bacterium]|nr:molybdopterin-dependent oxidoreductase [Acidobacteriota bacterium]
MARTEPRTLTMEFDGRPAAFPEGATVLRAAEINGVSISSLCSHKDLSPFGGCRLCMVEIEGLPGFPLSCSTPAAEGMKVRTESPALRENRREMLKLILSEHPSSCLICDESAACRGYQTTIRKAGVTTGCRFCPNDDQCELQDAIGRIGMPEIDYPILYHGFEPEHDDPFYDRDYNVCILCGRCVRMCAEVRGSNILAFTHRGSKTKIGPAFGRSHREAGCEFCGACVDVCPTGALADKASKWEGKPDGAHISTCPVCAIGCRIELRHKGGRLTRVKAHADPEVNDGQLCLKGRFCLPEATHHFSRSRKPLLKKGEFVREVSWDEAISRVAGELRGLDPGDFAMLASPDLTNESLYAAQKFTREVIGSANIDSTARAELAGGPGFWAGLFSLPISLKDIARSDVILAAGLDSRFDFSVVGTKIRQAIDAGARLVTVDPRDSNLARYTDDWLRPSPGREGTLLKAVAEALTGKRPGLKAAADAASVEVADLEQAVSILKSGKRLTVILGPQLFHYGDLSDLDAAVKTLSGRAETNFIPLYFGANSRGALELGVFPETGPEGAARADGNFRFTVLVSGKVRPKVLYLVGDIPFFDRPDCDFLIVQDTYLPPFEFDVFLPASSFAEAGGSLVNLEGRVQEVVQVENPPEGAMTGFMRPDWRIFSDLAASLDRHTMSYKTPADVFKDIRRDVPGFPPGANRRPRRMAAPSAWAPEAAENGGPAVKGAFALIAKPGGYRHRGIDLVSKAGGLSELGLEEGFRMNPADIDRLGVENGGDICITCKSLDAPVSGPAVEDAECPEGAVYVTRPVVFGGLDHRRALRPLFGLSANPVRVDVARAGKET